MLYRRGQVWWYEFVYKGCRIRESSEQTSKGLAREVEDRRKVELRNSATGIVEHKSVPMFSIAASKYLAGKKADWAESTYRIEKANLGHLKKFFGAGLLTDVDASDVGRYRDKRLSSGAAPKTVGLELGTLRAMLRYFDFDAVWSTVGKKVKLAKAEQVGRAITHDEQVALLDECRQSRSRSLYPAVVVALESCRRSSEIRSLRWRQIDFERNTIIVGNSKTEAGRGRVVPLSRFLGETLRTWANYFPQRKLDHFVFPYERYGGNGHDDSFGFKGGVAYGTDPAKPINSWKEAWEHAKKRSGVECRFHDLRHTGCTALLDAGVSHPVVAEIMGWSTSTAIRMIKEVYGHISLGARKDAIEMRERYLKALRPPQNPPQLPAEEQVTIQ